jgi:hypothetical protein
MLERAQAAGVRTVKVFGLILLFDAMLAISIGLLWGALHLGVGGDLGLEVGYYGQFNRVRHAIDEMPGVHIVDSWQHRDVTLEDFSFTVRETTGAPVEVRFLQGSPEMGERHPARIRAIVRKELATVRRSSAAGGTGAAGQDRRKAP